jgi:hypothetical protein
MKLEYKVTVEIDDEEIKQSALECGTSLSSSEKFYIHYKKEMLEFLINEEGGFIVEGNGRRVKK